MQPDRAKSCVVLGLGRFGGALALELESQGVEVLGIDSSDRTVQEFAERLTHTVQADTTDLEAMRQLAVPDFDRAVVGIGTNIEASILTASVLLDLGVPNIWAKAISAAHARILTQLGVHHVVRPEHDTGRRVAHLVAGRMLDYIEFDDGYAIVKAVPPPEIVGKTLAESLARSKFGVTVVGVKREGEDFTHARPDTLIAEGDIVIVSGPRDQVEAFTDQC